MEHAAEKLSSVVGLLYALKKPNLLIKSLSLWYHASLLLFRALRIQCWRSRLQVCQFI